MTSTIIIADDHAILRSGLRLLIDRQVDLEVIGEAENGKDALEQVKELQPNLILLDLNMPQMDGLAAIPEILQAAPQTYILVLTMHDDVRYLQQALEVGAAGYVLKQAVDTELLMAIRAVLRGETYIHSAMTQKLLDNVLYPPASELADPWKNLSDRELHVLRLVALGYTNAEIADELFLSIKTVETYRARGMEKLDLQTRAQLVKSALKYGYLDE